MQTIRQFDEELLDAISRFADRCRSALNGGGTVFFMGNGGSAADSQHLAAELVGRFQRERKGLPSVALTTDTSILTSVGNDYGFDRVFARQVEALVKAGDVVVGFSTSGNSANVIAAFKMAKEQGAFTVGMTGRKGGAMRELCDLCLCVPSDTTARIQEAHITIGHIVCELIEEV
nr:D-sedoheptulose 7-phosphate isomerase [Lucifera butyrica]